MADSSIQVKVEEWVRDQWMPMQFGAHFARQPVSLVTGGEINIDAVGQGGKFLATISTSSYKTSSGKQGSGKLHKFRSDVLFLHLADAQKKVMLFTEADMFEKCQKEYREGRVPKDIAIMYVELPIELAEELREARGKAASEGDYSPR